MSAFLDTVNIVSIAIILSVIFEMGRETLTDWRTLSIAAISFMVTFYFKKLNTAFIVFGGAVLITFTPREKMARFHITTSNDSRNIHSVLSG